MDCSLFLILFELLILFFAVMVLQCDILAPSVIVCFVFLISTIILETNVYEWEINISPMTVFVVVTGLAVFVLTGCFLHQTKKGYRSRRAIEIPVFTISNYKLIISFVFEMCISFLYYKEVVRIASYVTQSWGMGLIWKYRQMAFYTDNLTADQMMNPWVTQGYKMTMIIAYIMLFFFINNVVVNKQKISLNAKYLLLVPAYIFMLILAGNRLAIMNMVFFGITIWYILKNLKSGYTVKGSIKFVLRFLGVGILIILAFWLMTSVVQRYTKLPFWTTISIYAGAPIQLLNEYLIDPVEHNVIWGQESLINIHNSLYKLGISNYHSIINLEYRTYNGISLGNVYTTFRRYIQDFGILGMLIAVGLESYFYNWIYYKKIRSIKRITYKTAMWIVLYSFMIYPIFLFSIEEYFTLMWSAGYLITLVLFLCMFFFYTKVSFSKLQIRIQKW